MMKKFFILLLIFYSSICFASNKIEDRGLKLKTTYQKECTVTYFDNYTNQFILYCSEGFRSRPYYVILSNDEYVYFSKIKNMRKK